MIKKDLINILVNDYDYKIENISHLSKNELEEKLNFERKSKKNMFANFWQIKSMPKPEGQEKNGKEGTEKYAWAFFATWISMFIILGISMFLLIYFFAR